MYINLTDVLEQLTMGGVYDARVRGYNIAGARNFALNDEVFIQIWSFRVIPNRWLVRAGVGAWTETLQVYTFEDGSCGNEADATIWNANLAQVRDSRLV